MDRKKPRNGHIEALRLIAIVAIAIFHTFQPVFSSSAAWMASDSASIQAAASAGDMGALLVSAPAAVGALGFINLLGAYGNCIFFMISGFFLIPQTAQASRQPGYAQAQLRKTGRRVATIFFSVALYAALALIVSTFAFPLPGVSIHETGWLLGGLEFIWVYLAVMVAAPLIGWIWERCPHRVAAVMCFVFAVYAVNAYIAFISPGDAERGLLEWRKLMSAVSYLAAFLFGAVISRRISSRPTWARLALCLALILSFALELVLSYLNMPQAMVATSFKSTSAISFVLAALSLRVAAQMPPSARSGEHGSLATRVAARILGFYILQSMFYTPWRTVADAALLLASQLATGGTGTWSFLLLIGGTLVSVAIVAVFMIADAFIRMPLLRTAHLSR